MSVEPKYCIECAHSYADPGDTTEFLKCRNPEYGERDLVTGAIKWPIYWCSALRSVGAEKLCGREGKGWTLAPMDDPPPSVPRTLWQRLRGRP